MDNIFLLSNFISGEKNWSIVEKIIFIILYNFFFFFFNNFLESNANIELTMTILFLSKHQIQIFVVLQSDVSHAIIPRNNFTCRYNRHFITWEIVSAIQLNVFRVRGVELIARYSSSALAASVRKQGRRERRYLASVTPSRGMQVECNVQMKKGTTRARVPFRI